MIMNIMKKYLSTILVIIHLMSSIGYATVQHYCGMMQSDVELSENACCCDSEHDGAIGVACHISVDDKTPDSCCADEKRRLDSTCG